MPPIPEPPNLLVHFDLDDESLLLLQHPSTNLKSYSTNGDGSSISLSVRSSIDDVDRTVTLSPPSTQSRIWNAYYEGLIRRPLLVKSVTAFLLMVLADLSAQGVEYLRGIHHVEGREGGDGPTTTAPPIPDWLRCLRFGVFGLIGAPWTHFYYFWLDTVLPPTQKPWTWTTVGT